MRSRLAVLIGLCVLGGQGAALADDPQPGTPEWHRRDAENVAHATGRMQDMYTNPAFGRFFWTETVAQYPGNLADQLHHPDRPVLTLAQNIPGATTADPYRHHWEGERGLRAPLEYRNRYGARVTGNVWAPRPGAPDPLTGEPMEGPLPGVVVTTGSIQGYEELYWWAAQGLAEAGYVVMTFDVQGQGQSETLPHPLPQFCDPNGTWRAPQENGVQETGPCAGVPFQQQANFVLGTLDALDWFLSPANPFAGLLDRERIGLAGHSLGASAVTLVGNTDPRVDAVVGWDNIGLPSSVAPRVPTMGQNADYFFTPSPATQPPDPDAKSATFRRFRAAGVPSMQVALRGSTHLEWAFVPYILPASRTGERVALYYTLAWFDRWLKGQQDSRQRADAVRRLTATVFDGSSDRSSIGMGAWDPATGANVPYRIGGEPVAEHLSIYYRSAYAFDGLCLDDLRLGLPCR